MEHAHEYFAYLNAGIRYIFFNMQDFIVEKKMENAYEAAIQDIIKNIDKDEWNEVIKNMNNAFLDLNFDDESIGEKTWSLSHQAVLNYFVLQKLHQIFMSSILKKAQL